MQPPHPRSGGGFEGQGVGGEVGRGLGFGFLGWELGCGEMDWDGMNLGYDWGLGWGWGWG